MYLAHFKLNFSHKKLDIILLRWPYCVSIMSASGSRNFASWYNKINIVGNFLLILGKYLPIPGFD
jgi:hypothetical protein